jgi:hypothetical protein
LPALAKQYLHALIDDAFQRLIPNFNVSSFCQQSPAMPYEARPLANRDLWPTIQKKYNPSRRIY